MSAVLMVGASSVATSAVTQPAVVPTATGVTLNVQAGQPFTEQVGTLTGISKRGLHANVNWGDGTTVVRGFISVDRSGTLHISASHDYMRGGTFAITVKVWRGERRGALVAQFQSLSLIHI